MKSLERALARHGLVTRGGVHFSNGELTGVPAGAAEAGTLVLVGNAGGAMWQHFSVWLEGQAERPDNPLDRWSGEVIGEVAAEFGARAVFPWQKPYLPFQQWAVRAEGLKTSPLGMLIHPEYGLWHAYRGALLFDVPVLIEPADKPIHPCENCLEKPCLNACPVTAFSFGGFDAAGCRSYLDSISPQTDPASCGVNSRRPDCMKQGCGARDACPVGRHYRYPDGQVRFHMDAFARAGHN